MRVKMGNWSRDTTADKAITSPKSLPKCSEGKLGRETRGVPVSFRDPPSKQEPGLWGLSAACPQLPCPRPALQPHLSGLSLFSSAQTFDPQNPEKAHAGPWTDRTFLQAAPGKKRQACKWMACQTMHALAKEVRLEY